jgi:hypothetical protein
MPSLVLWIASSDGASLPLLPGGRRNLRLTAGGVLGGDAAQLLGGVHKSFIVFPLAWDPHATFRSRAHVPLESLSVSVGHGTPAPSP